MMYAMEVLVDGAQIESSSSPPPQLPPTRETSAAAGAEQQEETRTEPGSKRDRETEGQGPRRRGGRRSALPRLRATTAAAH